MSNGKKEFIEALLGQALGGTARVIGMSEMGDDATEREEITYPVTLLPEAQTEELKAIAARYSMGCQFRPGALVTPRPGFATKGVGQPHIVLEVKDDPRPDFTAEKTHVDSAAYGRKFDMRVACYVRNDLVLTFWVESYQYETFGG